MTIYPRAFKSIRIDLYCYKLIFLFIFSIIYHPSFGQSDNVFDDNSEEEHNINQLIEKANHYLEVDLDSAIYFGERAIENAFFHNFPELNYVASKILADAWYYKSDLSQAIDYYRNAADIIKDIEGDKSIKYASRIGDIGYCFYELELNDLAVKYYQEALLILKEANNIEEISTQLNNLGTVYFNWGNYNLAIEYFSQTLTYDSQRGDSSAISTSYNNIGKVYESWGYYDLAIEHYNNSIKFLGTTGNISRRAVRLSNIGTSYYKIGDFEKALEYLNAALEIDNQQNNPVKIAVRYNELANIYFAKKEYEKAIVYNQDALQIFNSVEKKESQAIVLKDLGQIYMEKSNYGMAIDYLQQSINLSHEIKLIQNEMIGHRLLGEVYEQAGDYRKAISFHQKYDELRDTIFNARNHNQLANYRIKYETVKKEQENQILKKDIILKQRTQRTLIIIGGFLLVSLLLLFFTLRLKSKNFKQDKKLTNLELEKKEVEKQHLEDKVFAEKQLNKLQREKFEAEIELKNRELVSSTLQLVNKNEVLTEIKNKINGHHASIPDNAYTDLIQLLNQNTDFDQNWKKFRTEFEKINPGFFDRIRFQYPDFSEQFLRLSAFLRIELSTKEIAQLMNVSVAAVNKNRQRLRKKLELEAEADLSTFLKSI